MKLDYFNIIKEGKKVNINNINLYIDIFDI